jgi:dihydrofolate reductase
MEAILAIDSNNGISKDGYIPWKSKKDMTFFYNTTKNNVVIMGKNTYLSLPDDCRPLKNRLNIVLTRVPGIFTSDESYKKYDNLLFTNNELIHEEIFQNKERYIHMCPSLSSDFKIYIIGGKKVYEKYIPLCKTVLVTRLKQDYSCDLFFNYDYKKEFKEEIYDEDDSLIIIKYSKL